MRSCIRFLTPLLGLATACAWAQPAEPVVLTNQVHGNAQLAVFQADVAPGSVSAMALIGLDGQVTAVENPRDLTVALRAFDGSNAFGLSITPARTSLTPMSIQTYNGGLAARALGATTLSYAQNEVSVEGQSYRQLAYAIEASVYLDAARDDPFVTYWNRLRDAKPGDVCELMPAAMPDTLPASAPSSLPASAPAPAAGPVAPALATPDDKRASDTRAQACRDAVAAKLRWNASRAWASFGTGSFKSTQAGGVRHGLGRTVVLGLTYGLGDASASDNAGAVTVGYRQVSKEPVAATYADADPVLHTTRLVTLRGAWGSNRLRALLEASNVRDEQPTASERVFKRALGLDVRLSEGMWLNVRAGRQRRIDNTGDETGASFGLSYSPAAMLKI